MGPYHRVMSARVWPALAGLVAGACGLAAGEIAGAVIDPRAAPLTAVGTAFVDQVPAWLKDLAVGLFGTADKTALYVGMVVVLAAVLVAIALVWHRRPGRAAAAFGALSILPAAAAMLRAGAPPLAWVPALACAAVGAGTVYLLLRRLPAQSGTDAGSATRRQFLAWAGAATGLAIAAGAGSRLLVGPARRVAQARSQVQLPLPAGPAPGLPAGIDPPVPGLTSYQTPAAEFFRIDTALVPPRVDPATWRLRVHGLVQREIEIDFEQLMAQDLAEAWVTLACVSNEVGGDLIGNAVWTGLPIRDLLARAAPDASADMVLSRSVDGWTASTPLAVLQDPDRASLLAVSMNGEPLPVEHGFPVRMVVPGLYGYVSATKWVTELEVTRFADADAYWTTRGWSARGPVKLSSRIDVPRPRSSVPAGEVVVAGVAWAQPHGIAGVQVQVDDGPWQEAVLADTVGPDTWRQWTFRWQASPGQHDLAVRATDGRGALQTADLAPVAPDGATGLHRVRLGVT